MRIFLCTADTADNDTIISSEVQVWLDMSNQQIGLMLNRDIQFSYRDFAKVGTTSYTLPISVSVTIAAILTVISYSLVPQKMDIL